MALCENLRTLRNKAGYTQAEMAKYLGISQSLYAQYETGFKAPTLYIAVKLAERFNISCEQLVKEDIK